MGRSNEEEGEPRDELAERRGLKKMEEMIDESSLGTSSAKADAALGKRILDEIASQEKQKDD